MPKSASEQSKPSQHENERTAQKQAEEKIEQDQDREPPRTAVPPGAPKAPGSNPGKRD